MIGFDLENDIVPRMVKRFDDSSRADQGRIQELRNHRVKQSVAVGAVDSGLEVGFQQQGMPRDG